MKPLLLQLRLEVELVVGKLVRKLVRKLHIQVSCRHGRMLRPAHQVKQWLRLLKHLLHHLITSAQLLLIPWVQLL